MLLSWRTDGPVRYNVLYENDSMAIEIIIEKNIKIFNKQVYIKQKKLLCSHYWMTFTRNRGGGEFVLEGWIQVTYETPN